MSRIRLRTTVAVLLAALGAPVATAQLVPDEVPEVPVLSTELQAGTGEVEDQPRVGSVEKTADGDPSDWIGTPTGFGGTAVFSAGEYVYQDHLFDARGADNGTDAERLASLDPLADAEPRTYRIEALIGQDPPSQFGIDTPGPLKGEEHYGDAGLVDVADMVEVRLGPANDALALLVSTTTMTASDQTGVLMLADTRDGGGGPVPFSSGLTSDRADVAVLLAGGNAWLADLATGEVSSLPGGTTATNGAGWINVVEAVVPRDTLGVRDKQLSVAVATGRFDGAGGFATLRDEAGRPLPSNIANVAFRSSERVRTWFERGQALDLHAGTIDAYFVDLDFETLVKGRTERYEPGPGYHDRIFRSAEAISRERGLDGVWQHYGLYLPDEWLATDSFPLQWWFHWRGGHAHSAAAVIPRMFQTLGDGEAASVASPGIPDSVVVAPRGRGTSTWYVGLGHADFLEVWDDVFALLGGRLDDHRVYLTGHSMGGWASYLMPVLYPDRFAGSMPYAGPVTQGAWTGADFPGCDGFEWDGNTPCYIEANGSRPRDQHTRKLLDNLRHVPIAVFQGALDELVPVSGVTRQVEQLTLLGYRHRYYLFPTYEHFSHPIVDEWADGGRYVHQFSIPEHPARVTYVRDMAFERATEQVQTAGFTFDFSFNAAYWMRGLEPASGSSRAVFDGRSLAIPDQPYLTTPEAGGPAAPGQHGPFVMTGLSWTSNPGEARPPTSNGFDVSLDGASTVELDLSRMKIDSAAPINGTVDTEGPLTLRLDGGLAAAPPVTCECGAVTVSLAGGVLIIELPAGVAHLTVG